jgi:uncharacterized protein YjiS (DUF1127 family)
MRRTARRAELARTEYWREQMAYITGNAAPSFGLGQRITSYLERVRQARKAREIYRTTYEELSALSDRDLADLGIARASISSVAREAAQLG